MIRFILNPLYDRMITIESTYRDVSGDFDSAIKEVVAMQINDIMANALPAGSRVDHVVVNDLCNGLCTPPNVLRKRRDATFTGFGATFLAEVHYDSATVNGADVLTAALSDESIGGNPWTSEDEPMGINDSSSYSAGGESRMSTNPGVNGVLDC